MQRRNRRLYAICVGLCILISISSCAHRSGHNRVTRSDDFSERATEISERKVKGHTKVTMKKDGGVYLVHSYLLLPFRANRGQQNPKRLLPIILL